MSDKTQATADEICQRNRDLSLMDTIPLCGMTCRPVSIRTFVLLKQCGSGFILGGTPTAAEVAIFLWFHSTGYCLDALARQRFLKSIRWVMKPAGYQRCLVEIEQSLAMQFMDSPASGGGLIRHAAAVMGIVDLIAREYGWPDSQILDMPIARAFLYRITILKRLLAERAPT